MTFKEAVEIFINRGYEQVDGGSIYNADKWRDSVIIISNWLQQNTCANYIPTPTKITCNPSSNFIIEELNKLSSVQPKLTECEDAISREQALKEFEKDQYHREYCIEHEIDRSISMEMVRIRLHDLPSVQPKQKTGHWIFTKTIFDRYGYTAECSSCHKKWETYDEIAFEKEHNYCFKCGTKMKKEGEE